MQAKAEWPQGWGLRELAEVPSTMAEAGRIAPGLAAPEWIFAHKQTAGHGRRGRPWVMPAGNLATTLVLLDVGGPALGALRSFIAALALDQALSEVSGQRAAIALKWPNDVLVNGGKIAGILLEMLPGDHLAIGIGVNLAAAPETGQIEARAVPPVALKTELGTQIAPLEFLIHLAAAFANFETQFRQFGFEPIRRAWLARATRLGQEITARMGQEEISGIFETVDADGQLLMRLPTGLRKISAAEISF